MINIGGTPQATTPTPAPTATIEPTTTPAAVTSATAAPTTTLSTSTPAPNGTPALANSGLCLNAYDDVNGNGTRESDETTVVAGVRFDVLDAQNQVVTSYTSDGTEAVHCLSNLPDGRYTIDIAPPPDYTATTDLKWSVSLLSGTSVNVNFGSHIAPAATATPEVAPTAQAEAATVPAPAERSTGAPLSLLIGGALVLLAIAALAFALSSRRR